MPFTFSHPAIVLPLHPLSKWFSMSALIIGSLTPDFEYFIRMQMKGHYGHTLSGIFWFDLPIAFIFYFIFHMIVRDPLITNLPDFIKARFSSYQFQYSRKLDRVNLGILTISCLIGICSHIFWDSFTHLNGFFVQESSFLQSNLSFLSGEFPVYKIFQHGSSLLGGLFIVFAVIKLPDAKIKQSTGRRGKFKYWGKVFFITMLVLLIRFQTGLHWNAPVEVVVNLISASLIALILVSFWQTVNKCKHKQENQKN